MADRLTEVPPQTLPGHVYAFVATILLWLYFTVGFVVFFLIFYLAAWFFSQDRERAFQRLNSIFYRGFFRLARIIIPRHDWQIDDTVKHIKSSVIVCNHVSYLDPLILISLFEHHKTIVKSKFFQMPVFGWLITTAGYLPSTTEGRFSQMMIDHIEKMGDYLTAGGNLFIFPEGTRSRDGRLGTFNKGAFKIARLCKAPIKVVRICNSDKLYTPGKFLFNTGRRNTITVTLMGQIDPDYEHNPPTASELESQVRRQLCTADCDSDLPVQMLFN